MAHVERLEEVILPTAILSGAFGDDAELFQCDSHEGSHGKDQFASVVMFSSMEIKKKNKTEKIHLVVKFNHESEVFRKSVLTDHQMQNEVFMYKNFLPFLNFKEELTPQFYYGVATGGKNPELDVILMEDLCKENYCTKNVGLELDYDHMIISLRQLAKLHAASYRAKVNHEEEFYERVEQLKEVQWIKEKFVNVNILLKLVLKNVMNELIGIKKYTSILEDFSSEVSDTLSYAKKLVNPSEPLSVVCHGDFNKDNILFQYDENGFVVRARLVDFGTVRYSSPIVDLSFILFSNTTSTTRRKYLDDFLTEYYNYLKTFCGEIQIPGIETFEAEFFSKAVYGFLECCLHIPVALSEPIDWDELVTMTEEQVQDYFEAKCNSHATFLLRDILKDLIKYKCHL